MILRSFLGVDASLFIMSILLLQLPPRLTAFSPSLIKRVPAGQRVMSKRWSSSSISVASTAAANTGNGSKGKILILGGTGFLGQTICKRAVLQGYGVTSLSRRGLPPPVSSAAAEESSTTAASIATITTTIDYRQGDARQKQAIADILQEGGYTGVVHCIGLLFDNDSGLGSLNRFVSGSGSLLDSDSTYDTITRQTSFNAIEAAVEYANKEGIQNMPFCFTSAAEAGWPDMAGGGFIESVMPEFIKRYLAAKRTVEAKLMASNPALRPIIVRPSLIYSMDRPTSYLPVGVFTVANKVGLPFVDRPVTVQSLGSAIVSAMGKDSVKGVLRYTEIDALSSS